MGLLDDKVVIITGAASGMGKAQSYLFAKEGAKVVLADVNEEIYHIAEEIESDALAVKTDISNRDDVKKLVQETINHFGTIDVVSNTAGIFDDYHALMETSYEQFDKVIAINETGTFNVMKEALPIMLEHKKGVYVNIASVASFNGTGGGFAYTASKSAIIGMTRSVTTNYKAQGIRANAICPGLVETPMTKDLCATQSVIENVTNKSGRIGTVEDIANTALFLASDKSDYINGASLAVDGGMLAE